MKTKKETKYRRGSYNKPFRVETSFAVYCTNDFKKDVKEYCKKNKMTISNYIKILIIEDANRRLYNTINQ